MASIPLPFVRRKVLVVTAYDKDDLPTVMTTLYLEKKTGELFLHYSNGTIAAVEWKEKEK